MRNRRKRFIRLSASSHKMRHLGPSVFYLFQTGCLDRLDELALKEEE